MTKKLYGTDPDQVPTNADLGTIAYQDKGNLSVGTVDTTGDVGINTASGLTDLTIAHYGHGLGLGYEGATLPSLAGLYTSSSATYGQAYGSLIVKSRTDYAGYSIIFRTQSGEAARFNSAGNLAFPSGKGIDFSASAGSGQTSSLLDDYEEGTWTPTFNSSSFATGITVNNAHYVKVGDLVNVTAVVAFTGTTGNYTVGDNYALGGLPFSMSDTHGRTGSGWASASSNRVGFNNLAQLNYIAGNVTSVYGTLARTFALTITITYRISAT